MIIKKGGFDSPLTNTITEYQSANAGAVSDATRPKILQTVALTPTHSTLKSPAVLIVNVSLDEPLEPMIETSVVDAVASISRKVT